MRMCKHATSFKSRFRPWKRRLLASVSYRESGVEVEGEADGVLTYHTSLGGLKDRASVVSHGDDSDGRDIGAMRWCGADYLRRGGRVAEGWWWWWWFLGATSVSTSEFLICWRDGGRAAARISSGRADNDRWRQEKKTGLGESTYQATGMRRC